MEILNGDRFHIEYQLGIGLSILLLLLLSTSFHLSTSHETLIVELSSTIRLVLPCTESTKDSRHKDIILVKRNVTYIV